MHRPSVVGIFTGTNPLHEPERTPQMRVTGIPPRKSGPFVRVILPALLPVLLLLCSSAALGYGFHDALNMGNGIDAVGIRCAALVGSKVFGGEGPVAVLLNPAGLAAVDGFQVTASGAIVAWGEAVVDSTSTIKRAGTGFSTATGAFAHRLVDGIVIAAGVAKVMDNQYDGTHYLPNDPSQPDIDRVEILTATGGLWEAVGGLSYNITGGVAVGASAGIRFGNADFTYTFDESYTPFTDSTSTWSWEEQEFCYHGGVTLDDGILSAGVCFISGSEHYEPRIAVAARAVAEHLANSRMGFEAEVISPFEGNYFQGKLSLETPIRSDFNILTGVGFYEGENMNRTGLAFSLGGDYRVGEFLFETAMYYSGRSRKSTSFPSEYSDSVEDNWTLFSVGISYGN